MLDLCDLEGMFYVFVRSSRFMLERGIAMREIHVMPPDNRPDL